MQPRVAFVILADGHKVASSGKVDAFGLFNRFFVWATPASRECSIIVGIEGVSDGRAEFQIFTRNEKRKVVAVGELAIESQEKVLQSTSAARLRLNFNSTGLRAIGIGPKGGSSRSVRWLPFRIEQRPWPELPTGARLKEILDDPATLKAMRATLKCDKCGRSFTFELSLSPEHKRERGVRPFPADGKFRCPKCSTIHQLRDIEGQFRHHLAEQRTGGAK